MSFLGSIGNLMVGSGLSNVLETVYRKNADEHIMTGKAIARAIRGYFLIDAALNMILLKELIPVMQDNQHDEIVSDNDALVLSRLWILYSDIVDKKLSVDEVVEEEYIIELRNFTPTTKKSTYNIVQDCQAVVTVL